MLRIIAGTFWLVFSIAGLTAAVYVPIKKLWVPLVLFFLAGIALFFTQEPLSGEALFGSVAGSLFSSIFFIPLGKFIGFLKRNSIYGINKSK